jgi:hypothetical protein
MNQNNNTTRMTFAQKLAMGIPLATAAIFIATNMTRSSSGTPTSIESEARIKTEEQIAYLKATAPINAPDYSIPLVEVPAADYKRQLTRFSETQERKVYWEEMKAPTAPGGTREWSKQFDKAAQAVSRKYHLSPKEQDDLSNDGLFLNWLPGEA